MKPVDYLNDIIDRIPFMKEMWKRSYGPGRIIEKYSAEVREELSQLKSDDIANVRAADHCDLASDEYNDKQRLMEYEKNLGIQPPPRKKYEE